jgi:hypothetical protein
VALACVFKISAPFSKACWTDCQKQFPTSTSFGDRFISQLSTFTSFLMAGAVASMTKDDPNVLSEKLPITFLVNWGSATKRARYFDVESE